MKISCIIPTHDRNNFLIEAISSVLKQSAFPLEIVVVNNGHKPVNLSANLSEKVSVYDIAVNAGASQARNFGAALAQGDYLAFLDDDDLWSEKYLENAAVAIKNGAQCVVSRLDKLENGKITKFKNADKILTISNILAFNPGITGSNIVIKKDILNKIGGFDVKLPTSEDKALLLELLKAKIQITILPENQTIRRMHGNGQLSDADKIAEGIYQFTKKYAVLMNKKEYLYNWWKIYQYRYIAGSKISGVKYIFARMAYLFLKLLHGKKSN
jgi:glycosyltransferase involved in cell wall biosynthesis